MNSQAVSAIGLRKPGDTRNDVVAAALSFGHVSVVARNPRTRADERHVALYNIDKLWQLVERRHAQDSAHASDAVTFGRVMHVIVVGHGAEFTHSEDFAVQAASLLNEEYWSFARKLNDERNDDRKR